VLGAYLVFGARYANLNSILEKMKKDAKTGDLNHTDAGHLQINPDLQLFEEGRMEKNLKF
jgi:hypothetical protein